MAEDPKNRRKHVRILRHFIVRYSASSHPSGKQEVTQINNISQGGMNFSTTQFLKPGEELKVELKTPFLDENLHLQGVILECSEKIPKLIYAVRLQFKDLPTNAKEILAKVELYSQKASQD